MSLSASALFSFLSLCGSRVHILMTESENPAPSRELSSEMLMLVTRAEQFIRLYMQMLGILSGPRLALLKLSRIALAFSSLSESFISGNGMLVAIGASQSYSGEFQESQSR